MNMAQRLLLFSPLFQPAPMQRQAETGSLRHDLMRAATAAQLAPRPYRPQPIARRIEASITKRR